MGSFAGELDALKEIRASISSAQVFTKKEDALDDSDEGKLFL
jgi:hypothetical protein